MRSWQRRIIQAMLIVSAGILPASAVTCDLGGGSFNLNLDRGWNGDYWDDDYYEEGYFYYEEDPWYYW